MARLQINRQLTEHEKTFLMHIKRAGRVSLLTLMNLGMSKELLQKLTNSGILVPEEEADWYTVSNNVFE